MNNESGNPDRSNNWFRDNISPDLVQFHRMKESAYSGRTQFQSVDIIETWGFGRCLVLDKRIQSSQTDEFIYHESLVQPAMVMHAAPKSVLIAGGGEGATLRQVTLHASVNEAIMVDIDGEVVKLCKEYLPAWHNGSFDDERVELVVADARRYIEGSERKFDVIILDLPEPLEGGPAYLLYTQEFYRNVRKTLNPGGVLAVQSDVASWNSLDTFAAIINTLKSVFPMVHPYQIHIPSFGGTWGFAVASANLDPTDLSTEEIDRCIAERVGKELFFYDGITHKHLFSLPKHLRRRLQEERRISCDASSVFAV